MITRAKARKIASEWYNGQWSALYKIACNETHEKLSRLDWIDARSEALKLAHLTPKASEAGALNSLVGWIDSESVRQGHDAKGMLA